MFRFRAVRAVRAAHAKMQEAPSRGYYKGERDGCGGEGGSGEGAGGGRERGRWRWLEDKLSTTVCERFSLLIWGYINVNDIEALVAHLSDAIQENNTNTSRISGTYGLAIGCCLQQHRFSFDLSALFNYIIRITEQVSL